MTQFEVKRGLVDRTAKMLGAGATRHAPIYAPGGIIALEGGAAATLGLMPFEIRRTRPGAFRGGFAKARVHTSW